MQISHDEGELLTMLVRLAGARYAVEVGTFTGYSSICIARGLPDGGRLLVLRRQRGVDRRSPAGTGSGPGVTDRIELRIAPAVETLRALPDEQTWTSRSSTPTRPATRRTTRRSCRGCVRAA